ncbi:hypothetical protein BC828DRAFT_379847 [Blastocladiella britannica]|nr:hypothetical protein BC828DRAFT_379847 [Blastocladiella britannica]
MSSGDPVGTFFKSGGIDAAGFFIQLATTLSIGFGAIAFFSIMRPRNPQVYEPNRVLARTMARRGLNQFFHESKVPEKLPEVSNGPFDWLRVIISTTDDQVRNSAGLDAAMFVRFLFALVKTAGLMAVVGIILLVLNYTAPTWGRGASGYWSGQLSLQLSHLSIATPLQLYPNFIWGHVVMSYILSGAVVYLLSGLWEDYVTLRQEWFRSPAYYNSTYARTMLVTNLSSSMLRDNMTLAAAMHEVNVKHFVSATLGLKVSVLQEAVERREKYVMELEGIIHKAFSGDLEQYKPDSAANLALPGSALPAEAQRLCEKICALNNQISDMRRNGCEAKAIHAGFVEFETPEETHEVVEQMHGKALDLTLETAPRPENLIWRNLGADPAMRNQLRRVGNLIVLAVCFGWLFPLAAIVPLTQPASLWKLWPDLGLFLFNNPKFSGFVQSMVPPILLNVFLIFLPVFFRKVADRQGAYTRAMRTRDTIRKMNLFYVLGFFVLFTLMSFFFKFISGFSAADLASAVKSGNAGQFTNALLEKFSDIALAISALFAEKGSFWLGYVANGTGFAPVELARAAPLITSWIKRRTMSLTPREELLINAPPSFQYEIVIPMILFYTFLGLVYAWIQPLILIVVAIYLCFCYLIYKWEILYVFGRGSDSMADWFPTVYRRVIHALEASLGLFVLLLACNKLWFQAIAVGILFVGVFIGGSRLEASNAKAGQFFDPKFGPLDADALRQDMEERASNRRQRYLHPALVEHLILPLVDPRVEHLLEPYFPELSIHYKPDNADRRLSQGSLSSAFGGVPGHGSSHNIHAHATGGERSPMLKAPIVRPASPLSIHKDDPASFALHNHPPQQQSHLAPQYQPRSPSPIGGMYAARTGGGAGGPQPRSPHLGSASAQYQQQLQQQPYPQQQQQQQHQQQYRTVQQHSTGPGYSSHTTTTTAMSSTMSSGAGGPAYEMQTTRGPTSPAISPRTQAHYAPIPGQPMPPPASSASAAGYRSQPPQHYQQHQQHPQYQQQQQWADTHSPMGGSVRSLSPGPHSAGANGRPQMQRYDSAPPAVVAPTHMLPPSSARPGYHQQQQQQQGRPGQQQQQGTYGGRGY